MLAGDADRGSSSARSTGSSSSRKEYRGNAEDYFDPRNSYLNEVIDRKLGIPIALSILYAAIADAGWVCRWAWVNLPMHFAPPGHGLRGGAGPVRRPVPRRARSATAPGASELLSQTLAGKPIRLGFEAFHPVQRLDHGRPDAPEPEGESTWSAKRVRRGPARRPPPRRHAAATTRSSSATGG